MGVPWNYLNILTEIGAFDRGCGAVLDIGSSNLYFADAADIVNFIKKYNPDPRSDLESFAARMEYGAGYDKVLGGRNGAFLGEIFDAAGFNYASVDIAQGYKTRVVDLNQQTLPTDMVGAFDLVINSGTTEHILNQQNAFKAIHDATKAGGFIWHSVPGLGYLDHGYFCYTGRFFFDLAGFNDYDLVDMWFDGPGGPENMFDAVRSYQGTFPALGRRLSKIGSEDRETTMAAFQIPTVTINVVYRKRVDRPFMGTVETSTSVGLIPGAVSDAYTPTEIIAEPSDAVLDGWWRRMRNKLGL